ncbi:MAG: hypothetical protein JNN05_00520 [Candidatus Omnitrophica bacterium]|nr:hypothetical protein [Candidatus Omnitrophota bacterium]
METKADQTKLPKDAVAELLNPASTGKSTMEPKLDQKSDQNRKARNTVGVILTIVMLGLTGYVLYIQSENYKTLELSSEMSLNDQGKQSENYRYYVKEYSTVKQQLDETQTRLGKMTMELELVSKELASTKTMLSETEVLLAQAQQENKMLKGDPQAMANMQKLFGDQVNTAGKNLDNLKKQNETYDSELSKLKGDLESFQTNAGDLKQGASLIKDLRSKIRIVKDKMRALKKDAAQAREAAQVERDRQLLLLGNNGFVTKDGELQLGEKAKKSVDIDVKFVP